MSVPRAARPAPVPLRRSPDFLKLWLGRATSLLGSEVTAVALPLTAVLTLRATPLEMGVLGAVQTAPYLLLGLLVGAGVDRRRRRPLLVAADFGRALLLASVPLAALAGALTLAQLYAVGFLVGVLSVVFEVAHAAHLPTLVARERLVEGNSTLEATRATAQIAGPGLGGGLVQALGAPLSIAADALSFLVSAGCLVAIRAPEPRPPAPAAGAGLRAEIGEGYRAVWRTPLLLVPAGASALYSLFTALWEAVYVLYLTEQVGLPPVALGLIYACGSAGALLGAVAAGHLVRWFGLGRVVVGAALLSSAGVALIPLAGQAPGAAPAGQGAARFLLGLSDAVFVVATVSVRQALTPPRLQGRVNATARFLADGPAPLGALIGGLLGERHGLQSTLLVGALGGLLPVVWLWRSPLRKLREVPAAPIGSASALTDDLLAPLGHRGGDASAPPPGDRPASQPPPV
jgi:MFS family permease